MVTSSIFSIGVLVGFAFAYISFVPVHKALQSLEKKYDQVINVLSVWQKKL